MDSKVQMRLNDFMSKVLPNVDPIVTEFLSEMLVVNANEMSSVDDVYEAVNDNLLAWDSEMLESDIRTLAEKFLILLHNGWVIFKRLIKLIVMFRKNVQKTVKQDGARKLDHTVDISSTKTDLHNIDSIWNIKAQDVPTMVSYLS